MSLNLSIIDLRVGKLAEDHREALGPGDEDKLRSRAFVLLVVSTVLDIPIAQALELLTDGGQDAAMDAIHVGDVLDGEFVVTLFQGEYKREGGKGAFPATEIGKLVHTVDALCDPNKPFHARHDVLVRVEELRSLVRDGHLPVVRVILCNNGQRWGKDAQALIEAAGLPQDQVQWEHVNHDTLVSLLQRPTKVDDQLQLAGGAVIEEFDFCRVLVGKTRVTELARLFETHGDRLLDRNIRRYLGLRSNRVNKDIAETLRSREERKNFYFFNNGVTLTCTKFRHNALQSGDYLAKLESLQVINGGQTCHTIRRMLADLPDEDFSRTFVLVRIYELDDSEHDLVPAITYATNSQNPVELGDLRANDEIQVRLELGLRDLGYVYARKREEVQSAGAITPARAAEAVLAVWRRLPHLARFHQNQLFGTLYARIFDASLTAAEVVVATCILDRTERACKQADPTNAPRFLPYAAHFLAMLIGEELLARLTACINHRNLDQALMLFDGNFEEIYERVVLKLRVAFGLSGIDESTESLQRLSATFRRGDLLEALDHLEERALASEAELAPRRARTLAAASAAVRTASIRAPKVQEHSLHGGEEPTLNDYATWGRAFLSELSREMEEIPIPSQREDMLCEWIRQLYPDKVTPLPEAQPEES
jgi:AIPR protein